MSTKEKLIERFKGIPGDFTFDEVVRLFSAFGFELSNKGGTSGSRVAFIRGDAAFSMHRPHPGNIVKRSALRGIKEYLEAKGFIGK